MSYEFFVCAITHDLGLTTLHFPATLKTLLL